ncbi:MAG: hypothetical protein ACHQ4F_10180 [Candidatus Dormibacteria bacterium]
MTGRVRRMFVTGMTLALIPSATAIAAGGGGGSGGAAPGPSSAGIAAVTHGRLVAGAGGTYLPIMPSNIIPTGSDPSNPLEIPPPGPNPQGMSCPPSNVFHVGPGSPSPGGGIVAVISIHPAFTRNAAGGYDGSEAQFAYAIAGAIPPGGVATDTAPGALATAANAGGHVIAVTAFLYTRGTWQDAQPVAPFGGSCQGAMFVFSPPYLAGNAPPPVPSTGVLDRPPFPTGANLVAALTNAWTVGHIDMLPGGSTTSRTFVHIPTCAWTDSTVPAAPVASHALTTTVVAGYTLFLLYDVTVTPGSVAWNWGDGTTTTAPGPAERTPAILPSYDPSTQRWNDPCAVSHEYAVVSSGATVTATETFTISIAVSWSDGVAIHTQPVACDPVTGADCHVTLGPGNGWQSGPHPVDQIEPVPYQSPSPSP